MDIHPSLGLTNNLSTWLSGMNPSPDARWMRAPLLLIPDRLTAQTIGAPDFLGNPPDEHVDYCILRNATIDRGRSICGNSTPVLVHSQNSCRPFGLDLPGSEAHLEQGS
jgi:hypothetical protein